MEKPDTAREGSRIEIEENRGELPDRALGILEFTCNVVALIALASLAARAAVRLEMRWDTFWYHLPFSARRGGLGIPYEMGDAMKARFQGFPPLPHVVQGLLWRLTGNVNATGVAGFLSFAAFLAYCHVVLRARYWLVGLIALSAPLVVIHAAASYVDLFGNSLLAIGLASCLHAWLFPERPLRMVYLIGLGGFVGAAWSKFQLVPVVAIGLLMLGSIGLWRSRDTREKRNRLVLAWVLAVTLAILPYAKNIWLHGNPAWPVRVPIEAIHLPYAEDLVAGGILAQRPQALTHFGQARLFLHSLLEIGHPTSYLGRPRWIIDQGNSSIAFRMGGFWGVGTICFLLSAVGMLVLARGRRGIAASVGFICLLGFVAVIPQSHELRYYLFIPLLWAAAIGMVYPELEETRPALVASLLIAVLGLFAYMVYENRVHYRIERRGIAVAAAEAGAPQWWRNMRKGVTYCWIGKAPMGMLLTGPSLSEFHVVDGDDEARCPEGSVVLDVDGSQRPRGAPGGEHRGEGTLDHQRAIAYLGASVTLFHQGRYAESVAAGRQAIEIEPDMAAAYNNVCAASNALGDWSDAIAACAKALELQPDLERARNNLRYATQRATKKGNASSTP